jgi:predicted pyridoxine 5'-phosphate oxidase superfamily flavin-nucleotide-binding protein
MAQRFTHTLLTPSVQRAQEHYYGRSAASEFAPEHDPLTGDEEDFIAARDSFYIATISENGWPYMQHRGGPPGFLHVAGPTQLLFADFRGNRQLLSTGNLAANHRVALFLMDYPNRQRLKILGHARTADAREHPDLVEKIADPRLADKVERIFFIDVLSYDWNCPKYITPRFTAAEVSRFVEPLQRRIAELEAQLKARE